MHVGRQVGLGVEHAAATGFKPVGVDIQIMDQDVLVARRKAGLAGLDHRQRRLADAKILSELLLRHVELLAYKFYTTLHNRLSKVFISNFCTPILTNQVFELIFALQS